MTPPPQSAAHPACRPLSHSSVSTGDNSCATPRIGLPESGTVNVEWVSGVCTQDRQAGHRLATIISDVISAV